MQITLKDLFAVVAFSAGMAWCGLQIGFDSPAYWHAIGGLVLMAGVFLRVTFSRRYYIVAAVSYIWLAAIGLAISGTVLAWSYAAAFLLVVMLLVSLLPQATRLQPRGLAAIVMVIVLSSMIAGGVLPRLKDVRELMAMRRDYPIIDLSPRLNYERQRSASLQESDLQLATLVSSELERFDEIMQRANYSTILFNQVHSAQFEKFIRAEGFGMRRMVYVRASSLERPELRNISFNDFVEIKELDSYSSRSEWIAMAKTDKLNSIEHLHRASRNDFLDSNAYGAVFSERTDSAAPRTGPINVAGFIEHGMHYPPRSALSEPGQWTIERLELVSLLKFDEPRVYVLDHLPRMDQLASNDAPTRALDDFEAAALPQLANEKDIVVEQIRGVDQQSEHFRMLGSLRAGTQCLQCHSVDRGELLGAFSYAIRRHAKETARVSASQNTSEMVAAGQ